MQECLVQVSCLLIFRHVNLGGLIQSLAIRVPEGVAEVIHQCKAPSTLATAYRVITIHRLGPHCGELQTRPLIDAQGTVSAIYSDPTRPHVDDQAVPFHLNRQTHQPIGYPMQIARTPLMLATAQ